MDGLLEITAVLIGFLVRLGIPVVFTLGIAWGLRRLDARWRREAMEDRLQAMSQAGEIVQPPCWKMKGCSPERRARCPVFQQTRIPCWEVYREAGELRETCIGCQVLQRALALSGV